MYIISFCCDKHPWMIGRLREMDNIAVVIVIILTQTIMRISKVVSEGRLLAVVFAISIVFVGCNTYKIPDYTDVASCEGCHTNFDHLVKVHTPDTTEPVGGCGGGAPQIDPYRRVYLDPENGYEDFKSSVHSFSCTSCHGGVDGTHEKEVAHSGDFEQYPSHNYEQNCGNNEFCHADVIADFPSSLHNGTGQKRKVTIRYGEEGPHKFDDLPHPLVEGYNANCATCHGTCGNCHVNRPPIAGGGLANGHKFERVPDMRDNCVKCHTSRGGHAYLGIAVGTKKDAHLELHDMECLDCHNGMELHGNGDTTVTHRYAYSELPSCNSALCHAGLETSNKYHEEHWEEFNCQVCHSQDYNNCGQCHVHGEGALVPSYMDFKIAKNPIPDIKPGYEFVLVRRTLAWQENWKEYGITYENFDAFPTYNYTSPHNILKITSRTDVGEEGCASKCHIRTESDTVYNADLFLFESDLLDWEINATSFMTVDGELPSGWLN